MRVLLIDLDTLRADHLGCYGYSRNTSPNIDRVAAEGVTLTNYYCSNAPCLPSRSALMSGQFGFHSGITGHGGTAADRFIQGPSREFFPEYNFSSLPALFRQSGCRTALISPFSERHGAYWFNGGFNEIYNTGKIGNEIVDDVEPVATKWLNENADSDNWFLYINFWDAHAYYRTPVEYDFPLADDPVNTWIDQETLDRHLKMVGPRGPLEPGMYNDKIAHGHDGRDLSASLPRQPGKLLTMADVEKCINGYDCGIRYIDDCLGRLFDILKEKGVWEDLCIIITADHGENFGELGIYSEHATADHATCHIPMIIKWNGCRKGVKEHSLHYNLDLLPTLADLLGKEKRPIWDGESYRNALEGSSFKAREYLVVEQHAHTAQRSVRFGDYLYIRTYHDWYHLFDRDMLFNLKDDPYEQHNIAGERPDLVNQACSLMLDWHDEMMRKHNNRPDPLWTVIQEGGPLHARGRLPEYIDYLKQTNREWAIPELTKRHPQEFSS